MKNIISFKKNEYTINNYKFILDWQNEVLTEYKTFQYLKNNPKYLPLPYLAYPWAFLIDIYNNKYKLFYSSFYNFVNSLNLLENLNDSESYITTIQSYHFKKYLHCFKKMGIKYIFSPHIIEKEFFDIFDSYNIIIFPYLIYPSIQGPILNKNIFYSFIGNINYKLERPTKIRSELCSMKHTKDCLVKSLDSWHFDEAVYGEQLNLIKFKNDFNIDKIKREEEYRNILGSSLFSLCPLGIGPNSIRLWESFKYSSIPVVISDNLWLPFYINVNWNDLLIQIKENSLNKLTDLYHINDKEMYQDKIKIFSEKYLQDENFGNLIHEAFPEEKKFILLICWFNITDENRLNEINTCLEKNLSNVLIKKIILFYECDDLNKIKEINHQKITIVPFISNRKRDVSFNFIVDYANKHFLNQFCIISNNDIYFDETLNETNKLNFEKNNYFVALTRKNCGKYLNNKNKIWEPHSASQDSWIFKTPIKKMNDDIKLGWIQCDNIIASNYSDLNYNVINPFYSINCWHLHKFNNTDMLLSNFNYNYRYKMKKVQLESIETIINKKNIILDDLTLVGKINVKKLSNIKKNFKLKK